MNMSTSKQDTQFEVSSFSVIQTTNPSTLLEKLLGDTSGLSNFDISLVGDGRAFGVFESKTQDFDVLKKGPFHLTSGVALSTGKVEELSGSNTEDGFPQGGPDLSFDFGPLGKEGDLISLIIEFDADDTNDELFFQYVFGSEEFIEYGGSPFNDSFSLELNGFNLARLSDGSAVTTNNLVATTSGYHPDYIDNPVGESADNNSTRIDGFTKPLLFRGPLLQNARNTLTINIRDGRDGAYDSAVLIKGGTLGTVEPEPIDITTPDSTPPTEDPDPTPPVKNPDPTPPTEDPDPTPPTEDPDPTPPTEDPDPIPPDEDPEPPPPVGGPEPTPPTEVPELTPLITVEPNGLLKLPGTSVPFRLTFGHENAEGVNEVLVAETDSNGAINGILPNQTGYKNEFFTQAKVVFSTLVGQEFLGLETTRTIEPLNSSFLQFAVTQGGSLDDLRRGGTANILFATPSANSSGNSILETNLLDDGTTQLALQAPGSSSQSRIVLTASISNTNQPLGAAQQGLRIESEVFDFSSQTKNIRAKFEVYREAKFNNTVGFYTIEDPQGSVRDEFGNLLQPGDAGYTQAALRNRVDVDIRGQHGQVMTYDAQLAAGNLYSTFIVVDGSPAQLLDNSAANDPDIFFNHIGANSDGVDHVRLIGDNTFGFEDLIGGGDQDFDDVVVKATFTLQ